MTEAEEPSVARITNYTWTSIGRPLARRHNIVLSRNPGVQAEGCTVAHSLDEALAAAGDAPEAMVIGGGSVYAEAMPRAERVLLTVVDGHVGGDVQFPALHPEAWRTVACTRTEADAAHTWAHWYFELTRASGGAHPGFVWPTGDALVRSRLAPG